MKSFAENDLMPRKSSKLLGLHIGKQATDSVWSFIGCHMFIQFDHIEAHQRSNSKKCLAIMRARTGKKVEPNNN